MHNYNIVGVDIALRNSGVSLYNTETEKFPFFGVLRYSPKFEYQYDSLMEYKHILYSYFESSVMPYADPKLPYLFVVEGITRKGHFHTTIKIMLTRAIMYNYIHDKEQDVDFALYKVLSPKVQEWKKALVGKGNASKPDTRIWLLDRRTKYNIPLPIFDDDDLVDATSLVLYGLEKLRTGKK